jgi:hypothetical protein
MARALDRVAGDMIEPPDLDELASDVRGVRSRGSMNLTHRQDGAADRVLGNVNLHSSIRRTQRRPRGHRPEEIAARVGCTLTPRVLEWLEGDDPTPVSSAPQCHRVLPGVRSHIEHKVDVVMRQQCMDLRLRHRGGRVALQPETRPPQDLATDLLQTISNMSHGHDDVRTRLSAGAA